MCFIGFAFWDAGLHPDEGRRALKYRACVQNVSDVIHRFRILGRRPTPRRGVKISQVPRPRTECVSCYSWACHFGMQTTLIGPGRLHANLFPKPSRPQVHSSADSPRIVCRCFYTHWGNINPTIASVGSPELMFSIVFYSHWGFISPTIASVGSPEFMLPIVFYPHWGNIRLTNCFCAVARIHVFYYVLQHWGNIRLTNCFCAIARIHVFYYVLQHWGNIRLMNCFCGIARTHVFCLLCFTGVGAISD
jgi:hypothetical protein